MTAQELDRICRLAEVAYPLECCGFLLANGVTRKLFPCTNVHETPETAYRMAARDLFEVARLEGRGMRVEAVFHSHVEGPAAFSEVDQRAALSRGVPIFPAADQVVVSVMDGRSVAVSVFRWRDGRFAPTTTQTLTGRRESM